MATLPQTLPSANPFNAEDCSADLLGRLGFRLPEPIVPDPNAPGEWPTLKRCRKASPEEALQEAVRCAGEALHAYPPGEAPAGLEERLEVLLSKAFRERRMTKKGKLGADRPALPNMRKGHMKSLPIDRVPEYRIVKVLHYVNRTPVEMNFLDGMRRLIDFFGQHSNRQRIG